MQIRDVLVSERVKHRKQIEIVKEYLRYLGVVPLTDIRIYRDYPIGWHAVVGGSYDRAYIITCIQGKMDFFAAECRGIRPDGTLIINNFERRKNGPERSIKRTLISK